MAGGVGNAEKDQQGLADFKQFHIVETADAAADPAPTDRVMVAKCGLCSTNAGRGLPANSTSRSAMVTMSPRAKSAALGPSLLSEDIIGETVEKIELYLGRRLGNQPLLPRGFLGKAGGAGVRHPDLQGAHPLRPQLVAAPLDVPSIR
jgi:hypothetical protein